MTKRKANPIAKKLAEALRMCANFHTVPDAENCWCGTGKHMGSIACLKARAALAGYARSRRVEP